MNLTLHVAPYSVNQYFYGNRSIKRRETLEWESTILEQLKDIKIQSQIEQLTNMFDSSKHCIHIEIKFYYPHNILYTKKKELSSKAFDITNVEKPLVDVLFLKKYSTDRIKNLQIDDKYITKMTSEKLSADKHRIELKIQLKDL